MNSLAPRKGRGFTSTAVFRIGITVFVCICLFIWAYIGIHSFPDANSDTSSGLSRLRAFLRPSDANFARFSPQNKAFVLNMRNPKSIKSISALPSVMIMTPVQNCARRLQRYFGLVEKMLSEYPPEMISIAFLDSGSTDYLLPEQLHELEQHVIPYLNNHLASHNSPVRFGLSSNTNEATENFIDVEQLGGTVQRILLQIPKLMELGVSSIRVGRYDYPFKIDRATRHLYEYQHERRSTIAMSRNRLTNFALADSFDFFFEESYCPDTRTLFAEVPNLEGVTHIPKVSSNCVLVSNSQGWVDRAHPKRPPLQIPSVHRRYDYTLLIDADLMTYEPIVLLELLSLRKEIVVPLSTLVDKDVSYDLNSWRANDDRSPGDSVTAAEVLEYHTSYYRRNHRSPNELIVQGYAPEKVLFLHELPKLGNGVTSEPLFNMNLSKEETEMHMEVTRRVLEKRGTDWSARLYRVDCIGGTMALVSARLFYQGLYFPSYVLNHRIETEGLSLVALRLDTPALSWATPDVKIVHA